jgi:hypothetical protein
MDVEPLARCINGVFSARCNQAVSRNDRRKSRSVFKGAALFFVYRLSCAGANVLTGKEESGWNTQHAE